VVHRTWSCSLSGAPSDACSDSARAVGTVPIYYGHCRRPLAFGAVAPLGAPDSPVNYSGAASRIPEGGKFRVELPVHRAAFVLSFALFV
jgi:hypothetical protein